VKLGDEADIDAGDVCAGGNVELKEGATIRGKVYAVGNVKLKSDATIHGDVYLGGDVSLDEGAEILGDYPLPYDGCHVSLYDDCAGGGPTHLFD